MDFRRVIDENVGKKNIQFTTNIFITCHGYFEVLQSFVFSLL